MPKPVTMADVARRAKVHQTTVSLALRNDPRLPAATRERIRQLAREMEYRPNPMVSALISERRKGLPSGRGSMLAFLTTHEKRGGWRSSPTYLRLFERMREHARERGYGLEEFWLAEPDMTPERMKRILLHRGIRGIVVCPLERTNHSLDFDFSEFSAVALGYTLRNPPLDHVASDYSSNMSLAIRHLLDAAFRRILFITTQDIDERVNHLSLGCCLAERRLYPGRILAPLVLPHFSRAELTRRLAVSRPDAILISTSLGRSQLKSWLGNKIPLASLDSYLHAPEPGIVRSVDEEAEAAVSFVTSRVERAQFGLPSRPRSILLTGRWVGPPESESSD